ncbi:MAG TPA: hypothetical protein VLZ83_15910 [Edaphocola sp.]|nr:hypothetical protein [Edaphocola sp.]
MKYILFFFSFIIFSLTSAQAQMSKTQELAFKKSENSLLKYVDSMNRLAVSEEKIDYCHLFIKEFGKVLKNENSFAFPFDTLSKKIHILYPEDKSFRVFNWPIEFATARFRYYGVIQKADGTLYPLIDQSDRIGDNHINDVLNNKDWFGQEYYRILTQKDESGKPIYFIFGVNHNRESTSIKIVDVIKFNDQQIDFGGQYFSEGQNRFIIEYQKGTQVSLNYDTEQKMIVFNVLESEINQPQRKHTLVPNGNLDGLKWNNYKWELVKNLIPIIKLQDGQAPVNGVIQSSK